MRQRVFAFPVMVAVLVFAWATFAQAEQRWIPLGPDGGDVRSLAHDPRNPDRMYLGTSAGYLYLSTDGGRHWARYARLGGGHNYVLDNIAIDPKDPSRIFVAAWDIDSEGGELFFSSDSGKSWRPLAAMKGKSIRALAIAPSDSGLMVAGALDGVFRSRDGGQSWSKISPDNHADIKNIESVAIDPVDPGIIYAGTWHLPWKTVDGGKTWKPIHKGMIDDSDVFSIIIDPKNPAVIYASACSGIYKSSSGGELFSKVQGIPSSARRTRVLKQDPNDADVVYAGTTEGLWRSSDAGTTWKRITAANLIVNDVVVDPRKSSRILLATDRSGVMVSADGGQNFAESNRGFAHRQVTSVVVNASDSGEMYAGVINDKDFGGVFVSRDRGHSWRQMSRGLGGRDIFTLAQSGQGTLLAGTNSGIFAFNPATQTWAASHKVVEERIKQVRKTPKSKPVLIRTVVPKPDMQSRVMRIAASGNTLYAATVAGLYRSTDNGRTWIGGAVHGHREFVSVQAAGDIVVAAGRRSVLVSHNEGKDWMAATLPRSMTTITDVALDPSHTIWVAAREGAFSSRNRGESFEHARWLPANNLATIVYDGDARRLLATAQGSTQIFESTDGGKRWRSTDSGWYLRSLLTVRGRLVATTAFDGLVIEPESSASGAPGGGSAR